MKVWVNGTFDVLHLGHIRLLEYAASHGEVRVGVDTDERVRQAKGPTRPFNTLRDRMAMLSSIRYVSSVVSFGTDDELVQCVMEYKPDIMVVGSDYENKRVIGHEHADVLIFFPKLQSYSTTDILRYETNINNRGSVY